jgi:chromosome segregation ATPase
MFKVRDLLIVSALVIGVSCGIYRGEIVQAARQYAAPAFWYVDAPSREAELLKQHSLEVEALREELATALALSGRLAAELAHQKDLFSGAESIIQRMGEEVSEARAELSGTRSRYAALCQRLLELGNDVPSVLAAE